MSHNHAAAAAGDGSDGVAGKAVGGFSGAGLRGLEESFPHLRQLSLSHCRDLEELDGPEGGGDRGSEGARERRDRDRDSANSAGAAFGLPPRVRMFPRPFAPGLDSDALGRTLRSLDLSGCQRLSALGGLRGLRALRELDLSKCIQVTSS